MYGEVQRAFIGVSIADVTADLNAQKNLKLNEIKGIYINSVSDGGAAAAAGLKENDVIVKFNGVDVYFSCSITGTAWKIPSW